MASVNSPAPAENKGSLTRLGGRFIELAIFAGLFAILYFNLFKGKSPGEIGGALINVLAVVVGIGFLIFIHELGHFLAAKWCDVKVETFSVGFGRAIPGCSFTYGETFYKLAMFPIGGYVKMLGQTDPGEEEEDQDAAKTSPRSYLNKTVGQRLFIISAGVIMNLLFGFLAFIYVYMAGKNEPAPYLGYIEPASPADVSGLIFGSELTDVDGEKNPSYEDLFYASLLSAAGKTVIDLDFTTPDGRKLEAQVTPRKGPDDTRPTIGVGFPIGLVLARTESKDDVPATKGSSGATAALRGGDKLLAVKMDGTKEPIKLEHGRDWVLAEFATRKHPIEILVQRGAEQHTFTLPPTNTKTLGLIMEMGPVVTISPTKQPPAAKEIRVGDLIQKLNGDDQFDPLRLGDLLADAAEAGKSSELTVLRDGKPFTVTLPPEQIRGIGTWNISPPLKATTPMAVPSLGLTFSVQPQIKRVEPGSPGDKAGFKPGMTLTKLNVLNKKTEVKKSHEFGEKLAWPEVFHSFQFMEDVDKNMELTLTAKDAAGKEVTALVTPVPDPTWFYPNRGLNLEVELRERVATGVWDAAKLGFRDTWRFVARIYANLYGFVTGSISPTLMAGPVKMAQATYLFAERGFNDLILFLAMISINLAVVNFLPIPVLDGGHAVMLIIEKLRGKPVNEKLFAYVTYAGLVFILGLMLFVVLLDLSKFDWWKRLFGG